MRRLVLFATLWYTPVARAQSVKEPMSFPEARADLIVAERHNTTEIGAGVQLPAGYYARIGVIGALGADYFADRPSHLSGRLDVIGRFLLDPFQQQHWALSAGGGVTLRARAGDHVHPLLVTVVDLQGPPNRAGVAPAFQLGLGGGFRIGGALRWTAASSR